MALEGRAELEHKEDEEQVAEEEVVEEQVQEEQKTAAWARLPPPETIVEEVQGEVLTAAVAATAVEPALGISGADMEVWVEEAAMEQEEEEEQQGACGGGGCLLMGTPVGKAGICGTGAICKGGMGGWPRGSEQGRSWRCGRWSGGGGWKGSGCRGGRWRLCGGCCKGDTTGTWGGTGGWGCGGCCCGWWWPALEYWQGAMAMAGRPALAGTGCGFRGATGNQPGGAVC